MPGPVVTMHAPVLIVPNVLTSEQCQLLMQQWHQGNQFEGKVGAGSQTRAQKLAKVRTDILLQKPMMAEVDRALGGTLFPEIEKVFGLKVTHREEYKIGCYDAAKGGFFKQHRDNFDRHLSHRRVAMTMNLNDDYGGGGLNFPEYGNFVYRPAAGGAVIFPCSLMHQALPVTSGKRFMMVSFFFGEAEVSHRLEFVADAEEYYAASKRHLLAPSK
ncbi:MAG: 2OG-Fe(II) oxygenase [Leptolyngbyaceae cyanobacterium SM1_1_3]|nr:2OG-Fe(II) oxygenase [Leptolyngbyaceae cyanobacterium SM1_1_3]